MLNLFQFNDAPLKGLIYFVGGRYHMDDWCKIELVCTHPPPPSSVWLTFNLQSSLSFSFRRRSIWETTLL